MVGCYSRVMNTFRGCMYIDFIAVREADIRLSKDDRRVPDLKSVGKRDDDKVE